MNGRINPGAIGVRVGVCLDAWQEAGQDADIGRFMNAARTMETLAAPYLQRDEKGTYLEQLRGLPWPKAIPENRVAAFEIGHQRVAVILCCLNAHGIYGFRQVPYSGTDDLPNDLDFVDDSAPAEARGERRLETDWAELS